MSFDVHLIPSSDTPDGAEFSRRFDAVMEEMGGALIGGEIAEMAEGSTVRVYGADPDEEAGSAMFAVHDFTPAIFGLIYRTADANSSFIYAGKACFRTFSNRGDFPEGEEEFETTDVAGEQAFLDGIAGEFRQWSDYRAQVVSPSEPESPAPEPKPQSFFSRLFGGATT